MSEKPSPPQILYHYTDLKGFLGILDSGCLWASSIHHLNDSQEFIHGSQRLLNLIRHVAPADGPLDRGLRVSLGRPGRWSVYVASLSVDGDELSQWRAYGGNGAGVAIGLQFKVLRRVLRSSGHHLHPCIYDEDRQEMMLLRLLRRAQARVVRDTMTEMDVILAFTPPLLRLLPRIKNPKFRAEQEWRIVFEGYAPDPAVQVRVSGQMLIPYRPCDVRFYGTLPLASIRLGPTLHPELLTAGAKILMRKHRFHMDPTTSVIPYRNW